ncbi:hypothetical protein LPICM02_240022 [Pseudolactococcus piscium]|nr:hypothetical protein LPICM02_240022 [Lactococcus piscium]
MLFKVLDSLMVNYEGITLTRLKTLKTLNVGLCDSSASFNLGLGRCQGRFFVNF